MKTYQHQFGFKQKTLVVALVASFGSVHAGDAEVAPLIKPDTASVSVGAVAATGDQKDRALLGQYNGFGKNSGGVLLDFDYVTREDATGTWFTAKGLDLTTEDREISVTKEKQGDWKFSGEYSEQVRHEPRALNTSMQGIGSAVLTVNTLAATGAGSDNILDLKRRNATVGLEKWVSTNFLLEASVKSERKDGARLSGVGAYCGPSMSTTTCPSLSGALLLLPEPIDSTTLQVDAKASYIGKNYNLTAGYYGSVYNNNNSSLRIGAFNNNLIDLAGGAVTPGTGANTLGGLLMQPIALAPDNQAHQIYLSGTYALTPTMRANFKYEVTHATQEQNFADGGLVAVAGLPANLGGVVDTTLTQLGLTARPLPKLSLAGNVRLEDVNDKTPQALYGGAYSNATNSSSKVNSKAQATYAFPDDLKGTLGVEYAWVKRDLPAAGSSVLIIPGSSLTAVREFTNEITYRAELRKPVTETLNASMGFSRSNRDGSRWVDLTNYQLLSNGAVYSATGAFPSTMMDRDRDQWRLNADWTASDRVSLQFYVADGRDSYSAPTLKGLHSNSVNNYGVDGSLILTKDWKATGYFSYGEQSIHVDHNAGYVATLRDKSTNVGLGVAGKLSSQWNVGADVSYTDDRNIYELGSGNTLAPGVLPDVSYRVVALKLYGKYAIQKNADFLFDLVHQNVKFDEWAWGSGAVPFAYSDNSTVTLQANQSVTYLGVKYVYRFK